MAQTVDIHENIYTELIDRIQQKIESLSHRLEFIMTERQENAEGRGGQTRLESKLLSIEDQIDDINNRIFDQNTPIAKG
jgi:peptidoglycan hydrolase CwlO-like protein